MHRFTDAGRSQLLAYLLHDAVFSVSRYSPRCRGDAAEIHPPRGWQVGGLIVRTVDPGWPHADTSWAKWALATWGTLRGETAHAAGVAVVALFIWLAYYAACLMLQLALSQPHKGLRAATVAVSTARHLARRILVCCHHRFLHAHARYTLLVPPVSPRP